jgi:hypothetical protein
MTNGILSSINTKDKLYKLMLQTPTTSPVHNTLKINLKTYKNILRRSIVEAKSIFYNNTFLKYKNDMKHTWDTIRQSFNNTAKSDYPDEFLVNGKLIGNTVEIANKFNYYFANI